MDHHYIVFDIGGTKTRLARVSGGELGEVHTFETAKDANEGIPLLIQEIKKVAGDFHIEALCGDMAGIVKGGTIAVSPNLPQWNGTNIVRSLQSAFDGAPVTFYNDAELIALGEYFYGAGKEESNMVYMTVSTGVGAVNVRNGKINRGQYNAEIGHQIIKDNLEVEELISGTAVSKRYGVHPKDLNDPEALDELASLLAVAIYNTTLHWSPDVFVLGGSMILGQNAIPLDATERYLAERVKKYYPTSPRITKGSLGDHGGLYGGMAFLKNRN